jgi:hypothetical protein
MEMIPGGHITCLKYHLKTIAEHMRGAILEAENDGALPGRNKAAPSAQESP